MKHMHVTRIAGALVLLALLAALCLPAQPATQDPTSLTPRDSTPQIEPDMQDVVNPQQISPFTPRYYLQPPPPGGCPVVSVRAVSSRKLPGCWWRIVVEKRDSCGRTWRQVMVAKTDGSSLPEEWLTPTTTPPPPTTPTITVSVTRRWTRVAERTAWATQTAVVVRTLESTVARTRRVTLTPPTPPSPTENLTELSARCYGVEEWLLEAPSPMYNVTLRLEVEGVDAGRKPPYARRVDVYLDGYPVLHIYAKQCVEKWTQESRKHIKLTLTYYALGFGWPEERKVAEYVAEGWVDEQAREGHVEARKQGSVDGAYEVYLGDVSQGLHKLTFRVTGLVWKLPEGWEDSTGGQEYVYGSKTAKADIKFKLTGVWLQQPKLTLLRRYGTKLSGEKWVREGWPLRYGLKKLVSYRLTRKVVYLGEQTRTWVRRVKEVKFKVARRYLGRTVETWVEARLTVKRYYDPKIKKFVVKYIKDVYVHRTIVHRWLKIVRKQVTWRVTAYRVVVKLYRVQWRWAPRVEERFCWRGG